MATWSTLGTVSGVGNDWIYYSGKIYFHDDANPLAIKQIDTSTGVQTTIGDANDFGFNPYLAFDERHPMCIFGGDLYMIFNQAVTNDTHIYKYDILLDTWTAVFTQLSNTERAISLTSDGTMMVAITYRAAAAPVVRYSTNGTTWTTGSITGFTPNTGVIGSVGIAEEYPFMSQIYVNFTEAVTLAQKQCLWDGVSTFNVVATYANGAGYSVEAVAPDAFWIRYYTPTPDQYNYSATAGGSGIAPTGDPEIEPVFRTFNSEYAFGIKASTLYYFDGSDWVTMEALPGSATEATFVVKELDSNPIMIANAGGTFTLYQRSEPYPPLIPVSGNFQPSTGGIPWLIKEDF